MSFRLVPKSMTLNITLNGAISLILRYFTEFVIASGAHCVKVVENVVVEKFTFAISSPDEFRV